MDIKVTPKKLFNIHLYLILVLLMFHLTGLISRLVLEQEFAYDLRPLFNFDEEMNVPTFFSAVGILFASLLLALIGWIQWKVKLASIPWLGLAMIFLFLSIDEIAGLHERLIYPVRQLLNPRGLLYYSWVIPYGMGLILVVLLYFKFVMRLPPRIRMLFGCSALLYLGGAMGFEMLGAWQYDKFRIESLTYGLLYTIEELLEMVGMAVFIYSLLSYIALQFPNITISLKGEVARSGDTD